MRRPTKASKTAKLNKRFDDAKKPAKKAKIHPDRVRMDWLEQDIDRLEEVGGTSRNDAVTIRKAIDKLMRLMRDGWR